MIAKAVPTNWEVHPIAEINVSRITKLNPFLSPNEQFEYYSIPAYQNAETPEIAKGRDILSQKLLIPPACVLFGKLNPRVEKVWNVRSCSAFRRIASTEWLPIVPKPGVDQDYLYYLMYSEWVMPIAQTLVSGSTPSRQRVDPKSFYEILVPLPVFDEQRDIARVLHLFEEATRCQQYQILCLCDIKRTAMLTLFTRGLRGEAQKETQIGPMPESWRVGRLGESANIISSRMAYTELQKLPQPVGKNVVKVLGVKVADMNLPGNEVKLQTAILERMVDKATAEYRCAPPRTIIFPKRGAAIATNKKRISIEWTAFDPNVIGIVAENELDQDFLFQWFQMFDLRTITDDGPTPQLNKKNLLPLNIPIPPSLVEQREIVTILDAIDQRIELHRRKRAVLGELFKALLHKLMTGETRVNELDLSAIGEAGGCRIG